MTAAIFQKARKNRVIALRTVAARNARDTKPEPVLSGTPRLELVQTGPAPLGPDDRSAA